MQSLNPTNGNTETSDIETLELAPPMQSSMATTPSSASTTSSSSSSSCSSSSASVASSSSSASYPFFTLPDHHQHRQHQLQHFQQHSFPVPSHFNQSIGFDHSSRYFPARSTGHQLRRASSASMDTGGKWNGLNARPASLQHHELLFPAEHQQQHRTTPLARKFEPGPALMEEREQQRNPQERQEQMETEEETDTEGPANKSARRSVDHPQVSNAVQDHGQQPLFRRNNSISLPPNGLNTFGPFPSSTLKAPSQTSAPPIPAGAAAAPYAAMFPRAANSLPQHQSLGPAAAPSAAGPGAVDSNVTLWQFLLELLAANDHPHLIQWTDNKGEFKLLDAEAVARLWGIRKGKPNMNYDKLSRALRYYYDKNIIKKVIGQKFVYRFVVERQAQQNGGDGMLAPGNPELVMLAMSRAGLNMNNGPGGGEAGSGPSGADHHHHHQALRNYAQRLPPPPANHHHPRSNLSAECSASTSANMAQPGTVSHQLHAGNGNSALTPSPANSSCSPTGSVESSSGVSSGSGLSSCFAASNGASFVASGTVAQVKSEPGLDAPSTSSAGSSAPAPLIVEKSRGTRKRKSPLEASQGHYDRMADMRNCSGDGHDRHAEAKLGYSPNTGEQGPSLSRRARPQPLDLTSCVNPTVNQLTGQMSQMVASSPLLLALQQQQQHQQQQSPLLSAALSAIGNLSNFAPSPAMTASPLAQAAAWQIANNLINTFSPSLNSVANNGSSVNNLLSSNGTTGNNNSNNGGNGNSLYSQLHSALTTPISQSRTPQQQQSLSNSAMISAVINHLANNNTPAQHQPPQPPQLFQFPPPSSNSLAHTLALISPGFPHTGQSPFPFASQLAALTPKFQPAGQVQTTSQRSPDSLKTPMGVGGFTFEFGQTLAAAAANKK